MRQIRAMAPDLLHLHWVGNGFIPIAALPRFGLPVVWTMHDMWPFTGGCHYADDCRRFTDACGHCPRLRSARNHDLSRRILAAKKRRWPLGRMVMVSPSHWLAGCARESALLRGATIRVVPNPIDTRLYRPLDRAAARSHLDWPLHDPIILVGSVSRSDDRRKGLDLLLEALPRVAARLPRCCLAVFGAASGTTQVPSSLRVLPVGHLQDDLALALVYMSADLVVTPSREDNLPNVMVEALACGTPVVAFRLGGFPDLIEDRVNGCLVTPFDAAGLAEAIVWSLTQADPQALREKACHRARQHCAPEVVAAQYRALYQELDAAAGFLP
jgi:glycosyltransferase involved in cell wall biosynthesis